MCVCVCEGGRDREIKNERERDSDGDYRTEREDERRILREREVEKVSERGEVRVRGMYNVSIYFWDLKS